MRLSDLFRFCCLATAAVATAARPASATSIAPPEFTEIVRDADFIGVIECETAGGIVANYRVVESWYGPGRGEKLSIHRWLNPCGAHFPAALCGQRFVVAVEKTDRPSNDVTGRFTGGPPLWLRRIPADYQDLIWGWTPLPLEREDRPFSAFGVDDADLETFRKTVKEMIGKLGKNRADWVRPRPDRDEADDDEDFFARAKKRKPADAEIKLYRTRLRRNPFDMEFQEAWAALVLHDTDYAARWLARWREPPGEENRAAAVGYTLGSEFAYYCPTNRVRHLRALSGASDPWVRVAAAVYLIFENEKEGIAKLKGLRVLKGDPGAWAALTLARRGDRSRVPRLLQLFAGPSHWTRIPLERWNLIERTRVLLSNTANASGLPQLDPPRWSEAHAEAEDGESRYWKSVHDYYVNWWKVHGAKAKLHDPWFEMLAKQKVD